MKGLCLVHIVHPEYYEAIIYLSVDRSFPSGEAAVSG